MVLALEEAGAPANHKCVRRLLREMGLEAIYPKPRLSQPGQLAGRFPYLLRGLELKAPDEVWASDITYIPMRGGWAYLVVLLD